LSASNQANTKVSVDTSAIVLLEKEIVCLIHNSWIKFNPEETLFAFLIFIQDSLTILTASQAVIFSANLYIFSKVDHQLEAAGVSGLSTKSL
jgi:hypothetical protein